MANLREHKAQEMASKREAAREKRRAAKETAIETKRRRQKEEKRKRQRKRKNPFPADKETAMKNRDGDPFWTGVLWLDSIHAFSVRTYGSNKKLMTTLVEGFLFEACR